MKRIIKSSTVLILAFIICFMAGCGANVSTKLSFDENFSGTREIVAVISDEDITKVTGGAAALENIIKEKKPADMDYSVKSEAGNTVITFTLKFSGLEEYRTKVNNIIALGQNAEDSKLVPEVVFENGKTYFKEGFKLSENFSSIDLLNWYINALEESGIISESKGNWYETGENKIVFSGKEYDSYDKLKADEQIKRCLSKINVETTVNTDGSFERVIEFTSDDDTEQELEKAGCNLEEYLKNLCPESDSFENTTEEDSYNNTYVFKLKADSAEELTSKTDAVLQTKNKFNISIKAKEDAPGTADISVTESIDGTYYIDYDDGYVTSNLKVYDNVEYADSDVNYQINDGYLNYRPNAGGEYTFNGEWKIGFEKIIFKASAGSLKKMEASLVFKPIAGLDQALIDSAGLLLEKAAEKGGKFEKKDNIYTVSFTGKTEDVEKEINSFIGYADDNTPERNENGDYPYFNAELKKYDTLSRLKKGFHGAVSYDFTPVIGGADIVLENKSSLFGANRYSSAGNFDGNDIVSESKGQLDFYTESISLVAAAVLAIALILLAAGIVMIIVNKNEFGIIKAIISSLKKPKAMPVQQAAVPDEQINEFEEFAVERDTEKAQPATVAAAAVQTASKSDSENFEEELL